jgi:o-succinylbenzoate---CoA ligase
VRIVNEPLSVFAAARDAPHTTALAIGTQRLTFGEVADLTRRRLTELAHEFEAGASLPLTGTNTLDTVLTLYAALEARHPVLMLHPKLTAAERAAEVAATERSAGALPADAAAILYTSGTTGKARAAVLTRAALIASAQASAANLGWHDDDCWLLAMPIARIGGLSIITRCLAARRTVALASAFDAELLPRWLDAHRVTLVSLVPTMLALLLDAHPAWVPPAALRAVLLGGAAASPKLLARAAERRLPIIITYGCTETCSQVVATPYSSRFEAARHGAGHVLPGVQLRIVDDHIEVRGEMLMAGYLGEPALAADSWFDTGDVGEMRDGALHVCGRSAERIVTGGENVDPAEVERALEDCPGILAAGVFGVPDETWGQIVAAAIVASADTPSDQTLTAYLCERLAPYKRPRRIVRVSQLPVTPAGKLDRAGLAVNATSLRPLRAA